MSAKVIEIKYSKHWPYTVAHTFDCVCSKINNSWFNPWFSFYFSSLYPAPYIEWYMCCPIQISYLNFTAVLARPKTAHSAQTHKSIPFIWIVWSNLYVYLCKDPQCQGCRNNNSQQAWLSGRKNLISTCQYIFYVLLIPIQGRCSRDSLRAHGLSIVEHAWYVSFKSLLSISVNFPF